LCGAVALVSLFAYEARGHGMDAYRIEVVSHGAVVELVATPPAARVAFADRDGDGLLSVQELGASRPAVLQALSRSLTLTLADGTPPVIERADVSVPHAHDARRDGAPFVRWTAVLRFPREAAPLSLRCEFASEHPVSLFATRADARAQPGRLLFVGTPEGAVLRGPGASGTLFVGEPLRRLDGASPRTPARPDAPRDARSARDPWLGGALLVGACLGAALARSRR
jgi:hypothetical protein